MTKPSRSPVPSGGDGAELEYNAATTWSMLSTQGLVLRCIGLDPAIRIREIAVQAGVTERTAWAAVNDLRLDGAIRVVRSGTRSNRYEVDREHLLPVRMGDAPSVGEFLDVVPAAARDAWTYRREPHARASKN